MIRRQVAIHLGKHRGRGRVYLQGKWLARCRFVVGAAVVASFAPGRVTVALASQDAKGARHISGKAGDVPVLDVNSAELDKAFAGCDELVLVARDGLLTLSRARTATKVATRCRNGREGSLFSGAGFLSQAAKEAGFTPTFAVEWDERYAEAYSANHPDALVLNQSVHEVDVASLPPVELLTIGIPCEPFSTKRQKGGLAPEAHELGDMVFWALRVVDALNPATVVIEEVPGFLDSGAGWIARRTLERMGYQVVTGIVGEGELAGRRRACLVATTGEAPVIPQAAPSTRTLGDVLDREVPEEAWFTPTTKAWLFEHWAKCRAKGSGFAEGRVLTEATTRVPCISKRYFNGQGDGVVVAHPTRKDTFRWLTVAEVARLHGVPDGYVLPEAKTVAGEVLGQAVVVPVWTAVIAANTKRG